MMAETSEAFEAGVDWALVEKSCFLAFILSLLLVLLSFPMCLGTGPVEMWEGSLFTCLGLSQ